MYHKSLLWIVPKQKIIKITYHKKYYQLYPHKKYKKYITNGDKKVKTNIWFFVQNKYSLLLCIHFFSFPRF